MGGSGHDGAVQKIARFIPSAQLLHHRTDGLSVFGGGTIPIETLQFHRVSAVA
jgi:hypothetical protein